MEKNQAGLTSVSSCTTARPRDGNFLLGLNVTVLLGHLSSWFTKGRWNLIQQD